MIISDICLSRVRTLALILVFGIGIAPQAFPQSASSQPEQGVDAQLCLPGAPRPACQSFVVAEIALLTRVINSRSTESILFHNGLKMAGDDFGFLGAVQAEFGVMFNVSERSAFGATVTGAMEEYRNRIGGKLHYRFWEGRRISVDLAAGVFVPVNEDDFLAALNRRQWVVGSFSLSQRDTWQFIFQLESYTQDYPEGRRASAFYSGVQFRDWPGPVPALFGLASLVAIGSQSL